MRIFTFPSIIVIIVIAALAAPSAWSAPRASIEAGISTLNNDTNNQAVITKHRVTGSATLVLFPQNALDLHGSTVSAKAMSFLGRYGSAFALESAESELEEVATTSDNLGWSHISFTQQREQLPVFGTMLRLHFDPSGELRAVNGTIIPNEGDLDLNPSFTSEGAVTIAKALLAPAKPTSSAPAAEIITTTLMVFRTGLLQMIPGHDRLVWEIEISDHRALHEKIYVDAHHGFIIERIDLSHDLNRVVHDVSYPNPLWSEGDALPYSGTSTEDDEAINNLIDFSGDVYEFFVNLSGGTYLSWDGGDAPLHTVYNADFIECPNAVSMGPVTGFCIGTTADDIVSHEWTHSYTGATHGLIYAWQSGALNESYSDIFGESVDILNGQGTDEPGALRPDGACSGFTGDSDTRLTINSPTDISGAYTVGGADFNPVAPFLVTNDLELVNDGEGSVTDGCQPFIDFTAGHIAVLEWKACSFRAAALNAEAAGASGVMIINTFNNTIRDMPGAGDLLSIPSVFLGKTDGGTITAALAAGAVNGTIASGADQSYRWLIGEDSTAFGGAIRDMWLPSCLGDPDKVTDEDNYWCSEDDGGGVHTNSAVPNHGYALLTDGGSYNGHTIPGIGMIKAAHIYWRAMTVYQTPVTNFSDHADFIELSCFDLIGAALTDLATGEISAEVIDASDCDQVNAVTQAVELRAFPSFCNFETVLAANPPAVSIDQLVFSETFETGPAAGWTVSSEGVTDDWIEYNWEWTNDPPEGAQGGAFFALNVPPHGPSCGPAGDQSGVMHLDSPAIILPPGGTPLLTFDHYVATDEDRDGGNLRISVNGGEFELVPSSAFRFNAYNTVIETLINRNPLAGEPAFSGLNQGSFGGSWGQSQVDLQSITKQGDTIKLRFDFGFDDCHALEGWYLDTVRIFMSDPVRQGGRRGTP